jgi:cobalt-zinc-cadmium efflux system membrane fusion protein
MKIRNLFAVTAVAITAFSFAACSKSGDKAGAVAGIEGGASTHTHEGWWCDEHGVPEEVCALCNSKLVADFKAKGDWCDKHNRPDSQCFVCHPEKEAEFAALYEAKYGKQPPKPEADGSQDHEEPEKT